MNHKSCIRPGIVNYSLPVHPHPIQPPASRLTIYTCTFITCNTGQLQAVQREQTMIAMLWYICWCSEGYPDYHLQLPHCFECVQFHCCVKFTVGIQYTPVTPPNICEITSSVNIFSEKPPACACVAYNCGHETRLSVLLALCV